MGKASRRKAQNKAAGIKPAKVQPAPYVARPFEGLPNQAQWVAMREIVPAGTAELTMHLPENAAELGFDSATWNSIDGTAGRDVYAEFSWITAMIAVDLSRISEEIILWNTREFGFVTLDTVPIDPNFARARQSGAIEVAEWDEGMFAAGLKAAVQRLPFLPISAGLHARLMTQRQALLSHTF